MVSLQHAGCVRDLAQPRLLGGRARMGWRRRARIGALPRLAARRRSPLHVARAPARLLRTAGGRRDCLLLDLQIDACPLVPFVPLSRGRPPGPQVKRPDVIVSGRRINGGAYGIRTRDLRLERAASWAARRMRRALAAELGFEPRLTDSESVVLPLHHSAV